MAREKGVERNASFRYSWLCSGRHAVACAAAALCWPLGRERAGLGPAIAAAPPAPEIPALLPIASEHGLRYVFERHCPARRRGALSHANRATRARPSGSLRSLPRQLC